MRNRLELYIHIPFCVRKCAYCDFLSAPAAADVQKRYVRQLTEEIRRQGARYPRYKVVSVYLGGGTPSVLEPKECLAVMEAVHACFDLWEECEITIEANPGTVTMDKLNAYREGGINRISIGLQSADEGELRSLGRIHTYVEFLKTYERVRQAGFANVNIDLMSAIPGQTAASWSTTLRKVAMLRPEHLSAYSLMVEEGTPFYDRYHGHPELLPGEEEDREMYYTAKQFLREQGYERYEISNYARHGMECRHNIGYWTGVEYLGLGLGASSYLKGCRFHNERDLGTYCAIPMDEEEGEGRLHQDMHDLSGKERMEEFMFLGLRMKEGVSGEDFRKRFGVELWEVYGNVLNRLCANRLVVAEGSRVRLSDFGIDISNYVLSEFLL